MRRTKAWILAGVIAAGAFAFGCGGKKEAGKAESSGGGSSAPAASTNKDIYVDKYKIGRTVRPDGQAGTESDLYMPGETVYQSFELRNSPPDSKVKLVFTSLADGQKVAEQVNTTGKDGLVSFEMKDTKSWKPGTYRVEYFMLREGDKPRSMGTHDLKIVTSRPSG
ncbi:MAG TPA: hypothetical protein VKJ00_00540 [Thermoanaerobaculia bacterium]|nr:hypothetical protein [Thermoanaerobaculia bacterium]HMF07585.1 hypothetical protein [Thermoanaerobaculia bacterium]